MSSTPLVASPTSSVAFAVPTFIANEATQAVVASSSQLSTGLSGSQLSVGALLSTIAEKFKVSSTTLYNLSNGESSLNPDAVGDHSCSYGLVQINLCVHTSVAKEDALDPTFALTYAAKAIKAGKEYQWTVCSCVKYAKTLVAGVPSQNADRFVSNTSIAHVGELALFRYSNGIAHVAVVTAVNKYTFVVAESNFKPCYTGRRTVSLNDPALVGFWFPEKYVP